MRNLSLSKPACLYAEPAKELDRDPRVPAQIVGTIEVAGRRLPARLSDLSRHGFGGRSVLPVPIGSAISVRLPVVGEVRAQVRWALGDLFGARFVDPVDTSLIIGREGSAKQELRPSEGIAGLPEPISSALEPASASLAPSRAPGL